MNFSTSAHTENRSIERIESLRHWWSLAGVDVHYKNQPATLLAGQKTAEPKQFPPPNTATETKPKAEVEPQSPEQLPDNYDLFLKWLSDPSNLVESSSSRKYILPVGPMKPKIMVISALPDLSQNNPNMLFSEKNQTLLNNMLAAIGCDSPNAYFASLAVARPADGSLEKKYWKSFRNRMMHHITLVRPERIIVLGDTAARIFFDSDLLNVRKKKQYINHVTSTTDAIATFHPRILIERPEFKAEAWKDLQLLTRIANP